MNNKNDSWVDDLRRERLQGSARNPGIAALMSFFVMGMGQIYAGHIDRGIMLMGVYFSGIFAAFSIYNGGFLYKAVYPLFGAHMMVIFTYVISVVFILLWIYNIKDAYYLSLFSSFRDWFEVERVLLPILKNQSENLIAAPAKTSGLLTHNESLLASEAEKVQEDADVVEIEASAKDERPVPDADQVVYAADFGVMNMHGRSWRLYGGLVIIFILVGVWLNNSNSFSAGEPDNRRDEALFAFSGDIHLRETTLSAAALPGEASKVASASSEATVATSTPELPFVKGKELVKGGDYAGASRLFEVELAHHEPDKDTWRIILNSFYRADLLVAYETNLRRYLKAYSEDSAAWFNLGKLLYDRSELAEASQAIVRGLRGEPDNVRGNFLLGSIYIDLNLYNDAITYLERSVNLEPLNVEFNRLLAKALLAAGRKKDSVRYFQRILSLVPDDAEAASALAGVKPNFAESKPSVDADDENVVLVVQGKSEAKLIERQSVDMPLPQTGKLLYESDVVEPAQVDDSSAEVVEVHEEQKPVIMPAAVVKKDVVIVPEKTVEKEPAKAPEKAPDKAPEKVAPVPAAAAEVRFVSKAPDKKIEEKPVVPILPSISSNHGISKKEATLSAAQNDAFRDSIATEDKKNDTAARKIEELRKKGASEFSRGNWESALPIYLEVLKHRRDAQTYDMVGVIFEKLSMHKDAFEAAERAYRLGQKDSAMLSKLGRLAETTNNYKKGEYYLYHALQKSPNRIDLRIRYARCLNANGNSKRALAELEKILRAGDSYAVKRRAELEIQKIKNTEN
ncbi:MAG: tetratricopeptide repeat protein [Erysipelotrichia bacterium]|nr:tetratricopeptide repeat protein [Erysipelotrichia bacterium]